MSSVSLRAVAGFLLLVALSCTQGPQTGPFLALAGPKDVMRMEVVDEEGETIWALQAQSPQSVDAIVYGVVPVGFSQIVPADGSLPRPLVPGELLVAETVTSMRRFAHTGVARDGNGMEILNYTMELLETQ